MSKIDHTRNTYGDPEGRAVYSGKSVISQPYHESDVRPGFIGNKPLSNHPPYAPVYAAPPPQPSYSHSQVPNYQSLPYSTAPQYDYQPRSYPPTSYDPYQYQYGNRVGAGFSQQSLHHPTHPQYPYSTIHGIPQPRPTQRRITYHPFTRTATDYEQRTVMVPVQKTRTKYYQKIFETNYIQKEIEQVVMEIEPVEKHTTRIEYVPVQKKIIHMPKDQKFYNIINPEKHPDLMKKMQSEEQRQKNQMSQVQHYKAEVQPIKKQQNNNQLDPKGTLRESNVQQIFSSKHKNDNNYSNYAVPVQ